jgi:hypothetical protein
VGQAGFDVQKDALYALQLLGAICYDIAAVFQESEKLMVVLEEEEEEEEEEDRGGVGAGAGKELDWAGVSEYIEAKLQ